MSGFDWRYFLATRNPALRSWMWPAVIIGGLLPIYLPLLLLAFGFIARNAKTILTGWAIAQAELLGALIVIAYKAFTGRAHPAHNVGADISHVFHFGWLRGGVFWGWPSSHTTIAFAMAVTVFTLYPKQRWLGLAGHPLRFLYRHWCFHDHPLVLGFRGREPSSARSSERWSGRAFRRNIRTLNVEHRTPN